MTLDENDRDYAYLFHALVTINNQIESRTTYGVREETVTEMPVNMIRWSNAQEGWYIVKSNLFIGDIVQLDANELLVPYTSLVINRIREELLPLPLFTHSFESVYGGIPERRVKK